MADPTSSLPNHLEPSPLGTREYWDSLYTTEIKNHSQDPTDEGTIWFDDSSAEDKVLSFLSAQISEKILGDDITTENCSFLDLGTGNGHFLFRLREGDDEEAAWGGRMLGVDYSLRSVEFAKRIGADKGFGGSSQTKEVEFKHWDIMTDDPAGVVLEGSNKNGWDIVLDKGTFDAISLSEENDASGRRICEGYKGKIFPLIRSGGLLLVTSCNWTEDELNAWFVGGELEVVEAIKYRSFSFGGKKGQTISSVCYRKRGVR